MKSVAASLAIFTGLAAAQQSYGSAPAPTTPAPVPTSTFTPACNPAHSYPNGVSCAGGLSFVTPSTSAPALSSTFSPVCNPAHNYPNGVSCAGGLSFVTPSTTKTGAATPSGNHGAQSTKPAISSSTLTPATGAGGGVAVNGALVAIAAFGLLVV